MKILTFLMTALVVALSALAPNVPSTPATMRWNENPFAKRTYGKVVSGGHSIGEVAIGIARGAWRGLTAVINAPLRMAGWANAELVAGHMVTPTLSAEVKQKKGEYDKLAGEALKIQETWAGKTMPQNVGEDFEAKCQAAEAIWTEIKPEVDRVEKLEGIYDRQGKLHRITNRIAEPTMPEEPAVTSKGAIAGYVTLGDYVGVHAAFQAAAKGGFRATAQIAELKAALFTGRATRLPRGRSGEALIALTAEERKTYEQAMDALPAEIKSLVSIGAGVLEPQRLDVQPQVIKDDRLRLRDVINIGQTTANAVSYIREESFTRAAAETTAGNLKSESALSYTEQTANVRTIAAWIPVTTDQLADLPQLRNMIDSRLLYDLEKRVEEQVMYGNGTPPNLEGILTVAGTTNIAASPLYVGGNDRLEHVRLGITEVLVDGYEANAMLIHPYDWFKLVVLKGSDLHYLGQVFMTQDREPRVWGISVVETIAAQEKSGIATPERNLVIGDFLRGCMLLDRMQASVQVGLNSDDFTKNRRTLLAETRVAFPIFAPKAFAYLTTQVAAT